jgi:hypothetical protein
MTISRGVEDMGMQHISLRPFVSSVQCKERGGPARPIGHFAPFRRPQIMMAAVVFLAGADWLADQKTRTVGSSVVLVQSIDNAANLKRKQGGAAVSLLR